MKEKRPKEGTDQSHMEGKLKSCPAHLDALSSTKIHGDLMRTVHG